MKEEKDVEEDRGRRGAGRGRASVRALVNRIGDVTTNHIENTWNVLKMYRCIYQTFPATTAQEFIDEFMFCRNCRTFNINIINVLIIMWMLLFSLNKFKYFLIFFLMCKFINK